MVMNKKVVLGFSALMMSSVIMAGCGQQVQQASNASPTVVMVDHQLVVENNPKMAKVIISQFGGPDGELAASMRYLSQRYSIGLLLWCFFTMQINISH